MLSSVFLLALSLGDGDLIEDFEDAGSENWERVGSDSHPPYNIVERTEDPERAKSGRQYLHFRSMGGSTAVRRSARHPWPVEAGRPYRASVWIRLSGTRRNAARLSLTWVLDTGDVLSETASEPLRSADGWTRLELDVPAAPAGATGVLPGLHFEGPDLRGVCDFDLLELHPAERLEIRPAGRALALFTPEDYPRFTLRPSGLPPGIQMLTVTLTASDGTAVTRNVTIDVPHQASAAVDFPPVPPGLYSLRGSADQHEATRTIAVLIVPPGRSVDDVPGPEGLPAAGAPPVAGTLQEHLLNPRRPFVPTGGFFDPDGTAKAVYFASRIVDAFLTGLVPISDPGLFPSGVRVAAFRNGASIAFALWTESGSVRLPLGLNDGVMVQPLYGAPRALGLREEVVVQALPTFLVQVDPLVADLRLEATPGELPLQLNPVRLALRLQNASRADVAAAVDLAIDSLPPGWHAFSRQFKIGALPAGSARTETVDLIVPPTETEREVDLKLGLRYTVRGKEISLEILKRIALTSPIRIESSLTPARILSVRIANRSAHPMTLTIRSRVPGLAERLDLLPDLPPESRSRPLEFPVPESGNAEIYVQEAGGDRALSRRLIPLR